MPTNWTDRTKPTTNWGGRDSFLLKQDSFFLLLQNGGKIIISMDSPGQTTWTDRVKP